MLDLNPMALGVATIAAFVISSIWYGALGTRMAALQGGQVVAETTAVPPETWKIGVELLRSLIVATVLAVLVSGLEVSAIPCWARSRAGGMGGLPRDPCWPAP